MDKMINYGIDLGTTNSAITKFMKGEIIVYNNPTDYGRNTLPSVVGFKKDKILVGSKAKELLERDPKSVVGTFKRKMGTSESFKIKSLGESKTPIDLSAFVLKELKTFLPPSEVLESAVITIPASFDTTQANATKEAGHAAGFKQVVLLQEPIAASLAYANMKKEKELQDGQWLVYDLGGGTFDVALLRVKDGEMKVLDHEGDNFLGGADFDQMIVDKIIIPHLNERFKFNDLENDFKSAKGSLNAKYYVLLRRAEEAKILLSTKSSAEIVVDGFEDENGTDIDIEIILTRSEFNSLIKNSIDRTVDMVRQILTRNSLSPSEVQFTLMVGGSTYVPYVRNRVEETLQIPINCEIDPTTAVAIGAAYYAATKPVQEKQVVEKQAPRVSIKAAYQKVSKEKEEFFTAKVSGDLLGLSYRITREDGGFDTGLKKLTERILEDLPLVENAFNFFKLTIYDATNNVVESDLDSIGINSGYGISGQPLPDDICLEVDDEDNIGETKLFPIFQKNAILPQKRTITRSLNKTIVKNSNEEVIRINVLEGVHTALPEANKTIGLMELTGRDISRDVYKGSDIEITIEMSESRDITIAVYLNMANQEFKQTYSPKARHVSVDVLKIEAENLSEKLEEELEEATKNENYEMARELSGLRHEVESLEESVGSLANDDVTDVRYQLEDKKRKLAQAIDNVTKDKRVSFARTEYQEIKDKCYKLLMENGNDHEQKDFNDIIAQESAFLSSNNTIRISQKSDELHSIYSTILWRTPAFLKAVFQDLSQLSPSMNDQVQANSLLDSGRFAIDNNDWNRVRDIIGALISLLPNRERQNMERKTKVGF